MAANTKPPPAPATQKNNPLAGALPPVRRGPTRRKRRSKSELHKLADGILRSALAPPTLEVDAACNAGLASIVATDAVRTIVAMRIAQRRDAQQLADRCRAQILAGARTKWPPRSPHCSLAPPRRRARRHTDHWRGRRGCGALSE